MKNNFIKALSVFICLFCFSLAIIPFFFNITKVADAGLVQDTIYSDKIYVL